MKRNNSEVKQDSWLINPKGAGCGGGQGSLQAS